MYKPHPIGVALLLLPLAACGDEFISAEERAPLPDCNVDPWQCSAGKTCWVESASTLDYECLVSGPAAQGAACFPAIGAPPCDDGLFCYPTDSTSGTCNRFCDLHDVAKGCPDGQICKAFAINVAGTLLDPIHVCAPPKA